MEVRKISFDAIGTHWNIQVTDTFSDQAWEQLTAGLMTRIEQFDATYSRFRDDSFIMKLSKQAGTYTLPEDAAPLLHFYRQLYEVTRGRVTPLIGQTMVDAGYDASYSFRQQALSTPPAWDEVLVIGEDTLQIRQPALLDVGAAGKGYLVDIASDMLHAHGATKYIIDAGGDMLHWDQANAPAQIGLENPYDSSEVIGIASLTNRSLCASAVSKRAWNDMHHIIDPQQLKPVANVVATWVIAATTMLADGLATALFFTAPGDLSRHFSFEYALLKDSGELEYSPKFPVTVFEASHA